MVRDRWRVSSNLIYLWNLTVCCPILHNSMVYRGTYLHVMAICLSEHLYTVFPLLENLLPNPTSFFHPMKHPLTLQISGKCAFFEKPSWPWDGFLWFLLPPCPDTCLPRPFIACNYAFICVISFHLSLLPPRS